MIATTFHMGINPFPPAPPNVISGPVREKIPEEPKAPKMIIGDLERRVLNATKREGKVTSRQMHGLVSFRHYTQSTRTLERLTRKNLLCREKVGGVFVYELRA